jgi:hypothetical protein
MTIAIRSVLLALASCALMGSAQWDAVAGAYHVHLVPVDKGFEVHVHDKAKHLPVDLTRGKVIATLLRDGKKSQLPLAHHEQKGIMTSAAGLTGHWTLLVAITLQGQKPAQARFTSTGASSDKSKNNSGHEHGDHVHQ